MQRKLKINLSLGVPCKDAGHYEVGFVYRYQVKNFLIRNRSLNLNKQFLLQYVLYILFYLHCFQKLPGLPKISGRGSVKRFNTCFFSVL